MTNDFVIAVSTPLHVNTGVSGISFDEVVNRSVVNRFTVTAQARFGEAYHHAIVSFAKFIATVKTSAHAEPAVRGFADDPIARLAARVVGAANDTTQ